MFHYPIINGGVSPVEFKSLFTAQERVQIKHLRKDDEVLDAFFDIIDDVRAKEILLTSPSTQAGLEYLKGKGVLNDERVKEILEAKIV